MNKLGNYLMSVTFDLAIDGSAQVCLAMGLV